MVRNCKAPDTEPEESNFAMPSEGVEHLFQVVDLWPVGDDIVTVRLEVADGEELGRSLLQRVNTNDSEKSFYYCRMFLKALRVPYKGEFVINENDWVGRMFYATVVHVTLDNGKKYCNIGDYNFEKQVNPPDVADIDSETTTEQAPAKSDEVEWDA